MGNYSQLFSCNEKSKHTELLSDYKYDIPLAYKIMVSAKTRLSRSFCWDRDEDTPWKEDALVAIIGDFKAGRERLFSVLKHIEKLGLFNDKEYFINHVKKTWAYLHSKNIEQEYALLECLDLFLMSSSDQEDLERQNKDLFDEVAEIDDVILYFIKHHAKADDDKETMWDLGIDNWEDKNDNTSVPDFDTNWEKVKEWKWIQQAEGIVEKKEKFEELVQSAKEGDDMKMAILGETYLYGIAEVVEPCIESAVSWLEKACENEKGHGIFTASIFLKTAIEKGVVKAEDLIPYGMNGNKFVLPILSNHYTSAKTTADDMKHFIDCLMPLGLNGNEFVLRALTDCYSSGKLAVDDVKNFAKQLADIHGKYDADDNYTYIIEKFLFSLRAENSIGTPFLEELAGNEKFVTQINLVRYYMNEFDETRLCRDREKALHWAQIANENDLPPKVKKYIEECLNILLDESWKPFYETLKDMTILPDPPFNFGGGRISKQQMLRLAEENVAMAQYLYAESICYEHMDSPYGRANKFMKFAAYWYQKAAEQGIEKAKIRLNLWHSKGHI